MKVDKFGRVRFGANGYRIEVRRGGINITRRQNSAMSMMTFFGVERRQTGEFAVGNKRYGSVIKDNWGKIRQACTLLDNWTPPQKFSAPAVIIPPNMRAVP